MIHWSSLCALPRGRSTLWLWPPVDGDSASPGQQLEALRRLLWRRRRQGQWQGADRVLETTSGRSARLDPLTSEPGAGCSRPSSSGSETAHDLVNAYYLGQDNRASNWYRAGLLAATSLPLLVLMLSKCLPLLQLLVANSLLQLQYK